MSPRPGFPLREGQKLLPPLLLDRPQGVMVPGAMNTYLREYQREGVRFFWDKYQQGRGGLLGDDMGLVSHILQLLRYLTSVHVCGTYWNVGCVANMSFAYMLFKQMKGKTIQVISFLSAIMRKHGDIRDLDRRRNHVSDLQDSPDWRIRRTLPPANARWPTCLIIAPSTVVHNWQREFEKVLAV